MIPAACLPGAGWPYPRGRVRAAAPGGDASDPEAAAAVIAAAQSYAVLPNAARAAALAAAMKAENQAEAKARQEANDL